MFLALAAVAAATPSPASTPLPTASPTVEAIARAVAPVVAHPSFFDTLNSLAANVSQPDIIVFAAALVVGLQTLVNRVPFFTHAVKWVQDARRIFLAVVLPFFMAAGTSLATGHNDLGLAPSVFLAGQVLFYVIRSLQKSGSTPPATDGFAIKNATVAPGSLIRPNNSQTTDLPRTANP